MWFSKDISNSEMVSNERYTWLNSDLLIKSLTIEYKPIVILINKNLAIYAAIWKLNEV